MEKCREPISQQILFQMTFIGTCLLSLFGGIFVFTVGGEPLFLFFLGGGVGLFALYVVICSWNPSSPNVRCPRCQQNSLVPLVLGAPVGVYCILCKYEDKTHSTHYLVPLKEVPK